MRLCAACPASSGTTGIVRPTSCAESRRISLPLCHRVEAASAVDTVLDRGTVGSVPVRPLPRTEASDGCGRVAKTPGDEGLAGGAKLRRVSRGCQAEAEPCRVW